MQYALLKGLVIIGGPLLLGAAMAYTVHYIVGFFVTVFASDEQAARLLKAYRGLIVPLLDLLALWAIGIVAWLLSA